MTDEERAEVFARDSADNTSIRIFLREAFLAGAKSKQEQLRERDAEIARLKEYQISLEAAVLNNLVDNDAFGCEFVYVNVLKDEIAALKKQQEFHLELLKPKFDHENEIGRLEQMLDTVRLYLGDGKYESLFGKTEVLNHKPIDRVWYSPQFDEIILTEQGNAFMFKNEFGRFISFYRVGHERIIITDYYLIGDF